MLIVTRQPIEHAIATFFDVQPYQVTIDGRTLVIQANSETEFNQLTQMFDEALEWRGIFHHFAIALGDRLLVLPLKEAISA